MQKVDLGSDHLSDDSSGKGGGGAVSDSHPEILTGSLSMFPCTRTVKVLPVVRIREVYPGSRIQKQQQKRGVKKNCCHTIFCSHKFHKIEIILIFNNLGQFSRNYRTFNPKHCQKALKNMGLGSGNRDPGSGIRRKPIPDPGSRGQKGTGSRIRIRNTESYVRPLDQTSTTVAFFSLQIQLSDYNDWETYTFLVYHYLKSTHF